MIESILDLLALAWAMLTLLASNQEMILSTGFGFGDAFTPSDLIAGYMSVLGEDRWNAMAELMKWLTVRIP